MVSVKRIFWYRQRTGSEEIIEGEYVNLNEALIILASLPQSPKNPLKGIGETIGFQANDGSFLEFEKIGHDKYHVRYENPKENEYRMGILPYWKARETLIDYFLRKRLRWLDELEPY